MAQEDYRFTISAEKYLGEKAFLCPKWKNKTSTCKSKCLKSIHRSIIVSSFGIWQKCYLHFLVTKSHQYQWRIQGRPSLRPKIFSISCSFSKKIVSWHPLRVGATSHRESWIRPWVRWVNLFSYKIGQDNVTHSRQEGSLLQHSMRPVTNNWPKSGYRLNHIF